MDPMLKTGHCGTVYAAFFVYDGQIISKMLLKERFFQSISGDRLESDVIGQETGNAGSRPVGNESFC